MAQVFGEVSQPYKDNPEPDDFGQRHLSVPHAGGKNREYEAEYGSDNESLNPDH